MYPVLILAAGTSYRMGEMKPFVRLSNGITLLEHLLFQYQTTNAGKITIVLNSDGFHHLKKNYSDLEKNLNIVVNVNPAFGRMESVRMGIKNITSEGLFVQNIDNPFVNREIIENMSNLLQENSYVVPVYKDKGGHPVLLCKSILNDLASASIPDIDFKVFLGNYSRINYICDRSEILYNLNTPEDLLQYDNNIGR